MKKFFDVMPPEGGGGSKIDSYEIGKMEELQKEMHKTIEWIMKRNPKLTYQDCVNVFLLWKISVMTNYSL